MGLLHDLIWGKAVNGGEGGGGSGDFSTAEITVIGNGAGSIICPAIVTSPIDNTKRYSAGFVISGTNPVILTEDGAVLRVNISAANVIEISGDITPMPNLGNGFYIVTGDCSIKVVMR